MSFGRIYITLSLSCILLFSTVPGFTQQVYDQVKAPRIAVSEWIGAQPPELRGKTLVLEFWATWCGGCIEAMPHLNDLTGRYGSDSVLFISINAYDKKDKINKFLERKPLKTWVAIDQEQETMKNFQVQSMPQTFLIDKNGWLRWRGTPGLLTDSFLQSFLEADKIMLPQTGDPLLYACNIAIARDRTTSSVSAVEGDKYGIIAKNRSIRDLILLLTSFLGKEEYQQRLTGNVPLEPALDLEIMADSSLSEAFVYTDLLQRLVRMFGGNMTMLKENTEIWYLTLVDEALLKQAQSVEHEAESFEPEENKTDIYFHQVEIFRLPYLLGDMGGKIVKSDLNMPGRYNIKLPFADFSRICETLEKKYGLRLVKRIEDLEVSVIDFK